MVINLPRILAGLILSALIGAAAYWRGSLTPAAGLARSSPARLHLASAAGHGG